MYDLRGEIAIEIECVIEGPLLFGHSGEGHLKGGGISFILRGIDEAHFADVSQLHWAAASLREGLEETLIVARLGLTGALHRSLRTTNLIENLNSSIETYTRNVKRWRAGGVGLCSSAG